MPSPLRSRELETRVIELVDLVLGGRRVEDDLIECKSEWPDPQKRAAARQLAGHANKARDEPILWIIGLERRPTYSPTPARSRWRTGGRQCQVASIRQLRSLSSTSLFLSRNARQ